MNAEKMTERIFQYMCRVRQQKEEQAAQDKKEGRCSAYARGIAFGQVLAVAYLIGYLKLEAEFQEWSEEHEKNKSS